MPFSRRGIFRDAMFPRGAGVRAVSGGGGAAPLGPDIDTFSFSHEASIDANTLTPIGISAPTGGGHIYFARSNTTTGVYYYKMAGGHDLSTLDYQASTNGDGQATRGIFIDDTGLIQMQPWFNASNPEGVFQWDTTGDAFALAPRGGRNTLSDISTDGIDQPYGFHVSLDGTEMYIVDSTDQTVYWYTLSTPYHPSTRTYNGSFNPTDGGSIQDVTLSSDGKVMYLLDVTSYVVRQYDLTTAWDITAGVTETGLSLDIDTPATYAEARGLHLAEDKYLYVCGQDTPEYVALFVSETEVDEHFDKVVLLIQGDEADGSTTFTDLSNNALTVTGVAGSGTSPEWDNAQAKFGSTSILFAGDGGNLDVDLSTKFADVDLGQHDFTVEAWIRCDTTTGADQVMAFHPSGNLHCGILVSNNSLFIERSTNGTTYTQTDSTLDVADDTWHHIAMVKYNGVITMYMDGAAGGTTVTGVLDEILHTLDSSAKIHIGDDNSASNGFHGWMDGIRITKGLARYREAFTPREQPFPTSGPTRTDEHFDNVKLLLDASGTHGATSTTDQSNDARTVTFQGNAQVTVGENHFERNSFLLDGTGDYLTVPDSADWNFSGAFTIEGWFKSDNNAAAQVLFSQQEAGVGGVQAYYNGSTDISVSIGSTSIFTTSDPVFTDDTWYHVALTRDGSNNWDLWLNGTSIGSVTDATAIGNSSSAFAIGTRADLPNSYWVGNITDFRITDGVARYTANFEPPRGSFPTSGPA